MPTALKKKPASEVAAPPPANARTELDAAKADRAKADAAVAAKIETIAKTRAAISNAEAAIERYEKAVEKARESDAKLIASNLDQGKNITAWHEDRTRNDLHHARKRHDALIVGRDKLDEDLKRVQDEAALAAYEVRFREALLDLPDIEKFADEVVADRARLAAKEKFLAELIAEPRRMPTFHDFMAGMHARKCLADVFAGVRDKLRARPADDVQRAAAESAIAPWRDAIAKLQTELP